MTLSLRYTLIALFFKSKGAVLRRNWEVGGKKANSQQAACLSLTKETRRPHGRLVIALPKWTSRRLLWAQIYGMANISRLQASQAHCWTCCRTAAVLQWASSYFAAVSIGFWISEAIKAPMYFGNQYSGCFYFWQLSAGYCSFNMEFKSFSVNKDLWYGQHIRALS